MDQTTTLAELRTCPPSLQDSAPIAVGMDTVQGFEALQRIARLFSSSAIVPAVYQGNLPNTVIAVDMAMRMGANPLMVMQNLYVVHGRPAWSAQFLIATFNKSGKFSALRYEFSGKEGKDDWACTAVAVELGTGQTLYGPKISIDLAKKEGWYAKNGSKWQTMPELMLRYRAAAWFVRTYAPEIAMGLQTVEEVRDTFDLSQTDNGIFELNTGEIAARAEREKEVSKPAAEVSEPQEATNKGAEEAQPNPLIHMIHCPDKDKPVDELDCPACSKRDGCPAWS